MVPSPLTTGLVVSHVGVAGGSASATAGISANRKTASTPAVRWVKGVPECIVLLPCLWTSVAERDTAEEHGADVTVIQHVTHTAHATPTA